MTRLALLLSAQTAVLVWLLRATRPFLAALTDQSRPITHLQVSTLLTSTTAVLALLAIAWLLIGTVHDTALAFAGRQGVAVAPRWVRRVINQAVGTTLLMGMLAGPAGPASAADRVTRPPTVTDLSADFSDLPTGSAVGTAVGTIWASQVAQYHAVPTGLPQPAPPSPVLPPSLQAVPLDGGVPLPRPPAPVVAPPAAVTPDGPPLVVPGSVEPVVPPMPGDPGTAPGSPQIDAPVTSGAPGTPEPLGPPDGSAPAGTSHTVARGENLWVIARGQLIGSGLHAPTDRDVHAYWVRLIAANQDGLTSGDPDLIFPGESLTMPEVAP